MRMIDKLSNAKARYEAGFTGDIIKYVGNTRSDVKYLIDEIERLQAENTRLRSMLDKAVGDLRGYAHCWVCKKQSGLFTCEFTQKCGKFFSEFEWRGLERSGDNE